MSRQQKKMNILILTSSYPAPSQDIRSSFGVFVRDFVNELSKSAKVSVITQYNISRQPSDTMENGVRVVRFAWAGMDKDLADLRPIQDFFYILSALFNGAKSVFQFVRQGKIDFIFSAWVIPGGFWALPAKWFLKTQFGVWTLGSDIWDYGKKPLIRNIISIILKNSKFQFADGFRLLKEMNQLSGKKGTFLSTTRNLPNVVKKPEKLKMDKKNLLFIGRYHQNKGVDLLIEAINLLSPKNKDRIHLHIFGGGPMEKELISLIAFHRLGDVITFNGWADEQTAASFMKFSDGLIIPSRIESIPVVLSDALQMGCPLIVSDVGDMGDIVSKYHAGMVIEKLDPEGICIAIETWLNMNMDKYHSGANELAQLFDLRKNTHRFLEIAFSQ